MFVFIANVSNTFFFLVEQPIGTLFQEVLDRLTLAQYNHLSVGRLLKLHRPNLGRVPYTCSVLNRHQFFR